MPNQRATIKGGYEISCPPFALCNRVWVLFYFVPCWWLYAQQVFDEEVVALVLSIGFAHGVACAWEEDELEVFVGLDEGVNNLVG